MSEAFDADLVVLSDIHLLDMVSLRGKRVLALVEAMTKGQVEALVLVGDIFEFMLGSNRYFHRKFEVLGAALSRLAQSGTKVVFLEGNHEFDIHKLDWPGVTMVQEQDYLLQIKGKKFKFTHGDLVYSPKAYLRFRKLVKARWFLAICRMIPGPLMDYLALRGSKASRAQDQYRKMDVKAIYKAMAAWLGKDADYGLFGHFHVPFNHKSGEGGELWSMASWDHPSVIKYVDGGFSRHVYRASELMPSKEDANKAISI